MQITVGLGFGGGPRTPGNDQTGSVRLEPTEGGSRLYFRERYRLVQRPWKWFEGPIYRFINRKNEESMRAMSAWLTAHPEYAPATPTSQASS